MYDDKSSMEIQEMVNNNDIELMRVVYVNPSCFLFHLIFLCCFLLLFVFIIILYHSNNIKLLESSFDCYDCVHVLQLEAILELLFFRGYTFYRIITYFFFNIYFKWWKNYYFRLRLSHYYTSSIKDIFSVGKIAWWYFM